jgi:predicted Zn-dependent peptidase
MLFNKTHEDYNDFLILNTIFGDYFGSRLMSNIREDKGYTYGIGTMVAELHETGYFLIATEVGKEVKDATLKEIKVEMERLHTELVSMEELNLVKNYMLGQLLKSADGPYSMTDLFMSVEPYGLSLDFYNASIDSINTITPERIQLLAKKYLNWNDMTIVSAG